MSSFDSFRRRVALAIGLLIASVAIVLVPGSASAATQKCPDTFRVLHDDSIGKLKLPKGHYRLTLLRKNKLTCSKASSLFTKFLEDYDGKLPGRWKVEVNAAAFVRGGSGVGFSVKRVGRKHGGGGGKHPANGGRRCPATFEVLHNDRIGKLKLPKGAYYITRLTANSPSCTRAAQLFAKFLEDPSGDLPPNWRLALGRAKFIKRKTGGDGFRVKPVS